MGAVPGLLVRILCQSGAATRRSRRARRTRSVDRTEPCLAPCASGGAGVGQDLIHLEVGACPSVARSASPGLSVSPARPPRPKKELGAASRGPRGRGPTPGTRRNRPRTASDPDLQAPPDWRRRPRRSTRAGPPRCGAATAAGVLLEQVQYVVAADAQVAAQPVEQSRPQGSRDT